LKYAEFLSQEFRIWKYFSLYQKKSWRPLTHLTLPAFIQRMTRTKEQEQVAQLFTADLAVFLFIPVQPQAAAGF